VTRFKLRLALYGLGSGASLLIKGSAELFAFPVAADYVCVRRGSVFRDLEFPCPVWKGWFPACNFPVFWNSCARGLCCVEMAELCLTWFGGFPHPGGVSILCFGVVSVRLWVRPIGPPLPPGFLYVVFCYPLFEVFFFLVCLTSIGVLLARLPSQNSPLPLFSFLTHLVLTFLRRA